MSNQTVVSTIELRRALLDTIEELAPIGSGRTIGTNDFCDTAVSLIAGTLVASHTVTAAEVERLSRLFRARLVELMTDTRDDATKCGHA